MRLTVTVQYLKRESRSGIFRYRRRVPEDLRLSVGKSFIDQTLETKDELVAIQRRDKVHQEVEALFSGLRNQGPEKLEYQTTKDALKNLGVWHENQAEMAPVLVDSAAPPIFERMTQASP